MYILYMCIKAQSHLLTGRFSNNPLLRVYLAIAPLSGDTPCGFSSRLSDRDCHQSLLNNWFASFNIIASR